MGFPTPGPETLTPVSADGRFMAFQTANASDPAGVGYGIVLYWFRK